MPKHLCSEPRPLAELSVLRRAALDGDKVVKQSNIFVFVEAPGCGFLRLTLL